VECDKFGLGIEKVMESTDSSKSCLIKKLVVLTDMSHFPQRYVDSQVSIIGLRNGSLSVSVDSIIETGSMIHADWHTSGLQSAHIFLWL
jgi:hypothetical protein